MKAARKPIPGVLILLFLMLALAISAHTDSAEALPRPPLPPIPPVLCQDVSWINLVNVTSNGNSIQKTSGAPNAWNAGAISTKAVLSGDGYVEAVVDSVDTYRMFGLSNGDSNAGYNDISYAAYLSGDTFRVYEWGLNKGTFMDLTVGDTIRVAVEDGTIKYYHNANLFYTSSAHPMYPLLIDTSIYSLNGRISNIVLCGDDIGPSPFRGPTETPKATHTPTSTISPTWTASPTVVLAENCMRFPEDNIWNRNIAALPTHVQSYNYVYSVGLNDPAHASFGSRIWQGQVIGMPYITVPGTQPLVPMRFVWWGHSDPGPYPVPTNAPIQTSHSTDRHVLVMERDSCTLYELYNAWPQPDGSWDANLGAKWYMTSNALRPNGWSSADASGLPILPALVRYEDIERGVINHALRFTSPYIHYTHVWPARHSDGLATNPDVPPMGTRFRLKASVDISGYPTQLRVILQALKEYGMILADTGQAWDIGGVPHVGWDDDILFMLGQIHGRDLEAVDESGLMIDPDSGQSR